MFGIRSGLRVANLGPIPSEDCIPHQLGFAWMSHGPGYQGQVQQRGINLWTRKCASDSMMVHNDSTVPVSELNSTASE